MRALFILVTLFFVAHNVCAMEESSSKKSKYIPKVYLEKQKLHQGPITRAELKKIDFVDKRVVDVGCGPGHHCDYMVEQGAAYVMGIDASEDMVKFAEENFSSVKIDYVIEKMENLDEEQEYFDLVISSFAFMYVPVKKQKKVLQSFYDLLCPGGTLLIIMAAKQPKHPFVGALQSLYQQDKEKWGKVVMQVKSEAQQVFSTEEYKAMLKEVGFSSESIEEGVTERSEPLSIQNGKEFEGFTSSWARGAYPTLTAMSDEEYKVFKRAFYNAYYDNRKEEDSSFDRSKPFLHPYQLLVVKVTKES